jgi:hypothetical protein
MSPHEDDREARLAEMEAALWRELQQPATQDLETIGLLLRAHQRLNEELRFGQAGSDSAVRRPGVTAT